MKDEQEVRFSESLNYRRSEKQEGGKQRSEEGEVEQEEEEEEYPDEFLPQL